MSGPAPVKARLLVPVVGVAAVVAAAVVAAPVVLDPEPAAAVVAVVVDAGVGAGTKEIATVPCFPPRSPNESVHEAPAAIWAVVGGQGYLAASAAGLPPVLSVEGQVAMASPAAPQDGPVVPAMTVNVVDRVPVADVVTSLLRLIELHDTGTFSLTGLGRATVGWLASLLHSRTVPGDVSSNPDPVRVTTVPPFRQVPGLAVRLGGPVEVVDFALHGTVVEVVVVLPAVVVVVVVLAVVVVVVVLLLVVVVVVPSPLLKEIGVVTWEPPSVPNAMTQLSPAETWAAVGGQG